eukprot:6138323-Karenia_brevis.AAC.1
MGGLQNDSPPSGWFPERDDVESLTGVKHLFPECYINTMKHIAQQYGPNVCMHTLHMLNHADIMSPNGNDESRYGDITPKSA